VPVYTLVRSLLAEPLNGDEVSPFGHKTTDFTVFDLADLTPPDPPSRYRLFGGLGLGLVFGLIGGLFKRSAASSRLTLVWPSTRRRLLNFFRRAGRGLIWGLILGSVLGLVTRLIAILAFELFFAVDAPLTRELVSGLPWWLILGSVLGLVLALGFGLLETRSSLITARTPKEARSRSLIAALTWLASGVVAGLVYGLVS
jgi:hypothetical protein